MHNPIDYEPVNDPFFTGFQTHSTASSTRWHHGGAQDRQSPRYFLAPQFLHVRARVNARLMDRLLGRSRTSTPIAKDNDPPPNSTPPRPHLVVGRSFSHMTCLALDPPLVGWWREGERKALNFMGEDKGPNRLVINSDPQRARRRLLWSVAMGEIRLTRWGHTSVRRWHKELTSGPWLSAPGSTWVSHAEGKDQVGRMAGWRPRHGMFLFLYFTFSVFFFFVFIFRFRI
jgi:hypothetical protein